MLLTDLRYRQGLVALIVLGALLRLTGLGWDEGRGLHPDEGNLVRAAVGLAFPDRLIPEFHAYNDLALWVPRLLALPFCQPGDAACLTWAARLASALFSLATIPMAAALARTLAGPAAGLAAAAAFATSAPLVQWAHFGTTESALAFLVVALWWLAVRWLSGQVTDRQMALWTGLLLGLGFGMKTTALIGSVIPLTALVLLGRPDRRRLAWLAGSVGVTVALALASTPSLWAATGDWLAVMRFESGVVSGAVPVFWTAQFRGAADVWYELGQLWSATAGAGAMLALCGLAVVPRRAWRLAVPGLAFSLIYAAIAFGWQAKFFRYLSPLLPVLLILSAVAVGRAVQPLKSRTVAALALTGLGLMAMAGVDQAAIYLQTDPRLLAEADLRRRAAPGDVVAVEPHDLAQTAGLAWVVVPLTTPDAGPAAIVEPLAHARWFIIASRRNWAVLPANPADAPLACAFYAALAKGDLGYVQVARYRRDGPFGRLFAPGLAAEETRAVFDRPEVLLFRNDANLPVDQIAAAITAQGDAPDTCTAALLAKAWEQPK